MRAFFRVSILAGLTLGLLVLAAVGSRQEGWRGDGGTLRDVPSSVIDSAYTLLILAAIAGLVAAAVMIRRARPKFKVRRAGSWQSVFLVITFALVVSYVLVTSEVGHRLTELLGNASGVGQQGDGSKLPQDARGGGRDPQFQWWLAVPIVTAALAGFLWYRRRHKPQPRGRRDLAEELELVLTDTLEDLGYEADPRRAVIRTYARMERVLAAHGLPRDPSEAPLEYLARVLRELNVRAEAAHALTELFERAKFSQHEIDVAMKDEAIAALETVRDDLKAAA